MSSPLTASQKTASALRRAEVALRNWQDEPNSPRSDVDKMLAIVADLRAWVQGHVIADIERPPTRSKGTPPKVTEADAPFEHLRREGEG